MLNWGLVSSLLLVTSLTLDLQSSSRDGGDVNKSRAPGNGTGDTGVTSTSILTLLRSGIFSACVAFVLISSSKLTLSSARCKYATISSLGRIVFTVWNTTSPLTLTPITLTLSMTLDVFRKRTQLQWRTSRSSIVEITSAQPYPFRT